MKAISVKQPWAWHIVNGTKDIENRKWKTKFRGRVLIQAATTIDTRAPKKLFDAIPPGELKKGGLIGSVEIVDIVRESDSEWFEGPYGYVLKDPRPCPFLKYAGQLKFFEVYNNWTEQQVIDWMHTDTKCGGPWGDYVKD